jgi:ubiquinone/menaquinone biosynthesis C-methylase UbiE
LIDSSLFQSLRPQLPALRKLAKRALDLGCGNHPIFDDAHVADQCFAADVQNFGATSPLVICKAEALPFADASFDLIVSRIAVPYMHAPKAFREIYRIMEPGGYLWATLHLPKMALRRIRNSARKLDVVDVVYQAYVLTNCCLLAVSSFQLPWFGRHFESVQTPRSIRAALNRAGFSEIETEICADERALLHFAVRARRQ